MAEERGEAHLVSPSLARSCTKPAQQTFQPVFLSPHLRRKEVHQMPCHISACCSDFLEWPESLALKCQRYSGEADIGRAFMCVLSIQVSTTVYMIDIMKYLGWISAYKKVVGGRHAHWSRSLPCVVDFSTSVFHLCLSGICLSDRGKSIVRSRRSTDNTLTGGIIIQMI
jgi:hypothetical protein